MNTLEEAVFHKNLSSQDKQHIEARLSTATAQLSLLKNQSSHLASDATKLIPKEQLNIIQDIVQYNQTLLPPNEALLHKIIQQEQELQNQLEGKAPLQKTVKPQNGQTPENITQKIDKMHLDIITRLEAIDFTKIAKIRKVEKLCAPSFNKIWIWVLEIYYGVASSKYFWDDFAKKALSESTDSGKELRRKMIIFDIGLLSVFQIKELEQITTSDIPLLTDKLPRNDDLINFFDVLKEIFGISKLLNLKTKLENSGPVIADVRVHEEEKSAIMTSQRLNAIKFDITSEVQNIYLLIDSEFK